MERSDYCHERQLYCIPKNFRIISFWPYFSYLYDYYALIMTLDHQLTSLLDHPLTHQLSKSWPTRFQTNRPTKNQINDHDQNQDQQNRKMQDWSRSRANQSPPNVFRNPRRLNPKFLSPNTSIIAKTKKQPQSTHHKKARVTLQQYRIHQIGLPPNTLYPLLNTVYYHNCSQLSFLRRAGIRKNLFHPVKHCSPDLAIVTFRILNTTKWDLARGYVTMYKPYEAKIDHTFHLDFDSKSKIQKVRWKCGRKCRFKQALMIKVIISEFHYMRNPIISPNR